MPTPRRLLLALLIAASLAALPGAAPAAAKTVWLCHPQMSHSPCEPSLKTTRFSPTGKRLGVDNVKPVRRPAFDCFYVYPTVSDQSGPQADFSIDPEQRSIALYQAARYSRDCRVYAPIYRQITIAGLFSGSATAEMRETGYQDVREAWRTYLRKFNMGRGVVLVSHSQGTFVLRRLIAEEIDSNPAVRKKLISALLLGGGVTVAKGKDTGGDFKKVRACRSRTQVGCVVAFSTFGASVPPVTIFGRVGDPKREVLCTNPAALGGGSAKVDPTFPRQPFAPGTVIGGATLAVGFTFPKASTAWLAFPGAYRARCSSADGANVLQIIPLGGAPTLNAVPDATWGLHLVDANIALGDLVDLVRAQGAAYLRMRR